MRMDIAPPRLAAPSRTHAPARGLCAAREGGTPGWPPHLPGAHWHAVSIGVNATPHEPACWSGLDFPASASVVEPETAELDVLRDSQVGDTDVLAGRSGDPHCLKPE